MSLTTSEMSPADLRAVMGNNNDDGFGFGGNGAWWIIILLLFGWGGRGYGFGGGFGGGQGGGYGYPCCGIPATQADLAAGFNNSAVLNNLDGIENALCAGFNGVNTAILQNGYNTQAGINTLSHQLADCCCQTQRAIDRVAYENQSNTCALQNTINSTTRDIIENANANSRAVLDFLVQSKLADKDARIATLEGQVARAEQNAFITANQEAQTATLLRRLGAECPQAAYVVQPPQPVTFPTNCCGAVNYASNGCGGCGSF
jgi:hypothetical protein